MTSNIGAEDIKRQTSLGFQLKRDEETEERISYEEMGKKLNVSLKKVFRPEFINRVDSVIIFRSLNQEDIRKIVNLELDKVSARLADQDITITASDAALELLAERGYDPDMGARPLRRVIQQAVEDKLSDAILTGEFMIGDSIEVDVEGEEVVLKKQKVKKKEPVADPV
jgi:ATP-dependent Clp protease ATP-binding subunit ClpC